MRRGRGSQHALLTLQTRMTRLALVRWLRLLVALLSLHALPAVAQETKVTLSVLGFTADAKQMLVQLEDDNIGTNLRLYDVATGQPAKKSALIPFQRGESQKVISATRKKFKVTDPGVEDTIYPLDPNDPEKTLSFFGLMATRERFVLAVTDRQKLGKVADIAIKKDEGTQTLAKAALKSLYWTTDRKWLVAIVTQKLKADGLLTEIDEAHALPFQPGDIRWVEPEPPASPTPAPKD